MQQFPPLPDPVTACTDQLVYCLTSGQADALARIVARAGSLTAVPALAREECTARAAAPSSAPWGT